MSEQQDAMNTLRFQLEKIAGDNEAPFWDAKLLADDLHVNGTLSIDWIDLAKSAFLPGNYFILTCGCGSTGCAGIDEPVKISHTEKIIAWHIIEPKPERRFEFDREQYRTAILEFLRNVKMAVPDSEDSMEYGFGYYGFVTHHLDWCVKTLETGIIEGTGYEEP